MHRRTQCTVWVSEELPLKHLFANINDRLRGGANMLCDWQDQLCRYWNIAYWIRRRRALVSRQAQTTVQFAEVIGRRGHESGLMLMQSTGQGATQSSQPVHSLSITVCIS